MLRINSVRLDGSSAGSKLKTFSAPAVTLTFRTTTLARVIVETSPDLVRWTETQGQIAQSGPGQFEARVPLTEGAVRFFRLRQIP